MIRKRNILFTYIILLILIFFTACSSNNSNENFDVQNIETKEKISIGMDKSDVDNLLGEPYDGGMFLYDENILIKYNNGKIHSIMFDSDKYETDKHIKVGNTVDDITSAYGNLETPGDGKILFYFLDEENNQCEISSAVKVHAFSLDERTNEVTFITISTYKKSSSEETNQQSPNETNALTTGQNNALKKAQNYLNTMPFSREGLINQLKYEGFSEGDSTFAADNCGADWNEQAAKKAEDYLNTMPFSKSRLIEQLKYDGFTSAQAEYGAKQNGY